MPRAISTEDRGTSGSEPQVVACPHLGLAEDQFAHYGGPSPEHRCYLWMLRERIDRSHQQRYCLSTAYTACPWRTVRRRPAEAEPREGLPSRLSQAVVERFDDLERVALRGTWPKLLLALLVFALQVLVTLLKEARRVGLPLARRFGRLAARAVVHFATVILPLVARRVGGLAAWMKSRGSEGSTAKGAAISSAEVSPDLTLAAEAPAEPRRAVRTIPVTPVERRRESLAAEEEAGVHPSAEEWTCTSCRARNTPSAVFCQRCARLSAGLARFLQSRGKLAVLEGLKAIEAREEELAHRCFIRATHQDPQDELAWRWRARTAASIADVVVSLEKLVQLCPMDAHLEADLAVARARLQLEAGLATKREAEKSAEPPPPAKPTLAQRAMGFARHLSLELSSIPCFALGLLLAGKPVRDALDLLDLQSVESALPSFNLPVLMAHLPRAMQPEFFPEVSVNLVAVGMLVVAVWYFRLAFQTAEALPPSRVLAVVSGAVSLAILPFVADGGHLIALCGVIAVVLAAVGKEASAGTAMVGTDRAKV